MQEKLLGLSTWLKMAFENEDFSPFIEYLLERAKMDENDSAALIDLSTIYYLLGNDALALQIQKQALKAQQIYEFSTNSPHAKMNLLILKTTGDLRANWPIELLLENSSMNIKIAYVGADTPWMNELPEHDLVINAIALTETNLPLLEATVELFKDWPRKVVNSSLSLLETLNIQEALKTVNHVCVYHSDAELQRKNGELHRYRVCAVGDNILPYQVVISDDVSKLYQDMDTENNETLRIKESELLNTFSTEIKPIVENHVIAVLNQLGLDFAIVEFALTSTNEVCIFAVEGSPLIHDYENSDKFSYRTDFVYQIQQAMMNYLISVVR